MAHENSITVRGPDGRHYNVASTGQRSGQILQGPFETQDEAVWHARIRSEMTPPEWAAPQLGGLKETMEEGYEPRPMGGEGEPDPQEITPEDWPADIYTG